MFIPAIFVFKKNWSLGLQLTCQDSQELGIPGSDLSLRKMCPILLILAQAHKCPSSEWLTTFHFSDMYTVM
jgi:hypothetical protein